jgi:NDP-sugar pyrophosphorylase family protein
VPEGYMSRAVVLAAGKGSRMGGITDDIPKPMLRIHGRPMLEHILEGLASAGLDKFLIVVGVQYELIEAHFRNWRLPVEFRLQQPVNGTATAALLARDFAGGEPFLLTYGDILCDAVEYTRCASVLQAHPSASGVIAVKAVDDPWQGAAVYEEAGRISRIIEKPPQGTSSTHWNSGGFYAFRPVIFEYLAHLQPSVRNEYELTSALDAMLRDNLELHISAIHGEWRDVGRPEDLAAVNR